jgi:hypothetical protein
MEQINKLTVLSTTKAFSVSSLITLVIPSNYNL